MKRPLFLITAVFLLFYFLAVGSMAQDAPTFDEQGFLVRGLGYLRGENRHMRVGHPLGLNALNASLLTFDETVLLPTNDPSWQETSFHRPAELFLWEIGNSVEHVMFLGRLPTIWLGMVLLAMIGRWARQMAHNRWAGVLALSLAAFDPNILAHTRLATTDLGLAAGAGVAGYTLWRWAKRPSWASAIIAGVGFGLLQNTKFTAGLFVPLFALIILIHFGLMIYNLRLMIGRSRFTFNVLRPFLQLLIAYPLTAFFTLWACYGFQTGTLPPNLPTFPQLSGLTLPLAHHIEQLTDIGGRLQVGTPAFLFGQYSDSGWWYYFPVAFLLKTPVPTLILLVYGLTKIYNLRLTIDDWAALFIPPLGYFAIALTTDINLGYRHLLPVLPFLFVFIATSLGNRTRINTDEHGSEEKVGAAPSPFTPRSSLFPLFLVLALLSSTVFIYPHFLSYFNLLAGGANNGWRYLVDSNMDWGQDLNKLQPWMAENGVEEVWLSYFGEARPEYYGIGYKGLDSFPPRLMNPQTRPFFPSNPAPGYYAISASNLQGVLFINPDQFAWFREREPIAKVGYSIFIYEVPATGPPVDLVLGNLQVDEIETAVFAQLSTNDVRLRWFDATQSLIFPSWESPATWLAMPTNATIHPFIQQELDRRGTNRIPGSGYNMVQYDFRNPIRIEEGRRFGLIAFVQETQELVLWGVEIETAVLPPGSMLEIKTLWNSVSGLQQPVKNFVHLVDANGNLIAQWDGLGAAWEGWQPNDWLLQIHQIAVPETAVPGTYQLWTGFYRPTTGQRWQTPEGQDRFLLGTIEIGD